MQNFIAIHNLLRWAVIILGFYALFRLFLGWLGNKSWGEQDRKAGLYFTIVMDIQILIGLILYFGFSDLTKAALQNFGEAMNIELLRFFALEHEFYMIVGLILLHIGNAISKKDLDDKEKFRRIALFFSFAMVLILFGTPWFRDLIPSFSF